MSLFASKRSPREWRCKPQSYKGSNAISYQLHAHTITEPSAHMVSLDIFETGHSRLILMKALPNLSVAVACGGNLSICHSTWNSAWWSKVDIAWICSPFFFCVRQWPRNQGYHRTRICLRKSAIGLDSLMEK